MHRGRDRVVMIELAQRCDIASVHGAAVGMDELAQRMLIEHFL